MEFNGKYMFLKTHYDGIKVIKVYIKGSHRFVKIDDDYLPIGVFDKECYKIIDLNEEEKEYTFEDIFEKIGK